MTPRRKYRHHTVRSAAARYTCRDFTACAVKGGAVLTLKEMSKCYREAAVPLRQRLKLLRQMLASTDDPEEIWHLKRRIAELTPLLTR